MIVNSKAFLQNDANLKWKADVRRACLDFFTRPAVAMELERLPAQRRAAVDQIEQGIEPA